MNFKLNKRYRIWNFYHKRFDYDNNTLFLALKNQNAKTYKGKSIYVIDESVYLEDKFNNELYENDIVLLKGQYSKKELIGLICRNKFESFLLVVEPKSKNKFHIKLSTLESSDLYKLGTIHQNKNLLEPILINLD